MKALSNRKTVIKLHFETFELWSVLVFAALILGGIVLQSSFAYLYLALLILDLMGTVFDLGALVSIDRSAFAVFFILFGAFAEGFSGFETVLSVIAIIVLLDFSFLLSRIQDTHILASSSLVKRLRAYVPTAGSAILVSYLFIFLYSEVSFALPYAILVFGVAMVSTLLLFVTIIKTFKNAASTPS